MRIHALHILRHAHRISIICIQENAFENVVCQIGGYFVQGEMTHCSITAVWSQAADDSTSDPSYMSHYKYMHTSITMCFVSMQFSMNRTNVQHTCVIFTNPPLHNAFRYESPQARLAQTVDSTVKPVYNDHLMGYLSAFWSSSRWPRAT